MDKIRNFLTKLKPERDCDLTDRLTHYYTVILLTIFAFIIFGWSLFGTPIQCWFPAQYKYWWTEYALDYCFVQNTYFFKMNTGKPQNHWELDRDRLELPTSDEERKQLTIGYYQWVPFVLALMAISFYMPIAFWRSMYEHSGISVRALCEQASVDRFDGEKRKSTAKQLALYIDHTKQVCERFKNTSLSGRYVTALYLFCKLLAMFICVGQFFVLEHFLGLKNGWWGLEIFNDVRHGREWTETGNFPRVTFCDYKVRELGNIHHHTVQCVLLINMLNEKFFVFLWFWFFFLAILSSLSLCYWLFYALYPNSSRQYIIAYLMHVDPSLKSHYRKAKIVDNFINTVLKVDGVFVLRLISQNSGDMVCAELVHAMWDEYKKKCKVADFDDDSESQLTQDDLKPPSVKLAKSPRNNYYDKDTIPMYRHNDAKYPPLPKYDDLEKPKNRRPPPVPPKPDSL